MQFAIMQSPICLSTSLRSGRRAHPAEHYPWADTYTHRFSHQPRRRAFTAEADLRTLRIVISDMVCMGCLLYQLLQDLRHFLGACPAFALLHDHAHEEMQGFLFPVPVVVHRLLVLPDRLPAE